MTVTVDGKTSVQDLGCDFKIPSVFDSSTGNEEFTSDYDFFSFLELFRNREWRKLYALNKR
ncbi:hypothetical protein BWQ96_07572 [Gracilariopsis chorda]|uniref:Uncharacterized protein n=1 Tax=Gracilariopsis chorda TaxID=448386 RepID=A0A2V3IKS4_9FLOR|nr:hypothetical protein BWQ96_07572 [Gracilariopsis chorda]|eukprot:PXF42686.1 hypothetical protein BWQ96_07572 [Gracilariopsis chorda]